MDETSRLPARRTPPRRPPRVRRCRGVLRAPALDEGQGRDSPRRASRLS